MKIAMIADVHANIAALESFPETYDELWVIGDLVNFGPSPAEVVAWIRERAHCVVRGNHDHAVGYDVDPRCISAYQAMAAETSRYSAQELTRDQREYLRLLPLTIERIFGNTRFHLCHATPSDPLYGYAATEEAWMEQVAGMRIDTLVVGHTHEPLHRKIGNITIVNPGSLAGLRITSPQASYAVWEDGHLQLKRYSYPVDATLSAIWAMPISDLVKQQLSDLLMRGDFQHQP